MRDILVVGIVLIGAIWALRRPWIGVMLWTWLSIMNPHRLTWGFAFDAPLAAIAAVATLLGLLATKEKQSPFQGTPIVFLCVFMVWITLSWFMGVDVAGDYEQWNKVMKIYLMTLVAAMLLLTKNHIMAYAWVTTGSLAILAAKGGLFTIVTGGNYRVWGPGGFIGENNAFALAVLVALPLVHFLQMQLSKSWHKNMMSIVMLLCVASALGSQSRGAFVALGAMGAMFWWRSERKGLMSVLILTVLIVMLPMMPETWWARMESIKTYQEDTSAMGRLNAWIVAWEVAKHNIFGVGMSYQHQMYFSLFGVYENIIRAAHSIYFQILGNHGFIGLIIYLSLWITTYRTAGWLRSNARSIPEAKWAADMGSMIQVSLIGFAAGGAFLSLAYFDLPYNMMVMVVLARKWVEKRAWEMEPRIPFSESIGLARKKESRPSF